MTNFKFFTNRWLMGLLTFIVVGLVVTFILRLLTPAQPVVPKTEFITENQVGGSSQFANLRFTGSFTTTITELPLVVIQPSQTTLDYVRNQLIKEYQLNQVVGLAGLWRGETHPLSYNDGADEYLFYSLFTPKDTLLADTNRAIEVAETFVSKTFPNVQLVSQRNAVQYFSGLLELEETTRDKAVALAVPFTYTVQNVPIFLGHTSSPPLTVMINSLYEVQKVTFQPNFIDFVPTEQKARLIDLGTVLDNINSRNEASIISAYSHTGQFFTLEEITSGTLTDVQLEYRADFTTGLAYPFYHFSGELNTANGYAIQAEIIAPAVETK